MWGMFASEIENHEKLYPGQQVEVKNGLAMIHTTYRSKLRANIVFGMLVDALLDLGRTVSGVHKNFNFKNHGSLGVNQI